MFLSCDKEKHTRDRYFGNVPAGKEVEKKGRMTVNPGADYLHQ